MFHVAAFGTALLLATEASAMGNFNLPPAVPEPAAVGLFAAGGAVVAWALYRHRNRK